MSEQRKPFDDNGNEEQPLPIKPEQLKHIPGAPTPEQRSRIITDALKEAFPTALAIEKPGEREQAIRHLEHHTVRILRVHQEGIRRAMRNGIAYSSQQAAQYGGEFKPEFRDQVDKQVWNDIRQAFAGESKESLHHMLCVVLVGMWTEKLEEVN